jgi:N6-adenosine-specific RNA methylase IME4
VTRYRTIVADPPWQFESAATKADARKHYDPMTLSAIAALPVASMADDSCHLWLWGVNGMMREAHEVALTWGFRPITLITWCKPQPGVGHYLRNNTEHCIFARAGSRWCQRQSRANISQYGPGNARVKKAQQAREAEQAERDAGLQAQLRQEMYARMTARKEPS